MDVFPHPFGVKELPRICFEGIYEGGKVAAMKRRRVLIEADPKRKEAKAKKKLAKLKAKAAKMQRKKEKALAKTKEEENADVDVKVEVGDDSAENNQKRKREDAAADGGDSTQGSGEEEEETALLESALDMIHDDLGVAQHKTREEAEIDRQKLLAGELLFDGEEDTEISGEGAAGAVAAFAKSEGNKRRKLNREEIEAEQLKRVGLVIVSDDEAMVIGGNRVLRWRRGSVKVKREVKKEDPGTSKAATKSVGAKRRNLNPVEIKFKTKFDVVELDASGHVIDKGDDDFKPSMKWTGRVGGFEFKLGERGLGYYRTGKKVVVPSNVAYS